MGELADHHGVSKNRLLKTGNELAGEGVLETTWGSGGGLRLMKDAWQIRVGGVVCLRDRFPTGRVLRCRDQPVHAQPLGLSYGLAH